MLILAWYSGVSKGCSWRVDHDPERGEGLASPRRSFDLPRTQVIIILRSMRTTRWPFAGEDDEEEAKEETPTRATASRSGSPRLPLPIGTSSFERLERCQCCWIRTSLCLDLRWIRFRRFQALHTRASCYTSSRVRFRRGGCCKGGDMMEDPCW